jgi:4-hydroxy-3-methylbut-2-enyl diphosphate reductase
MIRHKPVLDPGAPEVEEKDWLPSGPFQLGITAGASTPNNKIGEAVLRILQVRSIKLPAGILDLPKEPTETPEKPST